jgi:putative membrane protein
MMWDDDNRFGGHSGMMTDGGAVTWLMLVLMVALLVALVIAIVLLARRAGVTERPDDPPASDAASPEGILDERLARGEIDEDEYLRRRAALVDR